MVAKPKRPPDERYRLRELAFVRRDIHMAIETIDKIENIVAVSIVGVATALLWRKELPDLLKPYIACVPLAVWAFYFVKYLGLQRNIRLADYYLIKAEERFELPRGWVQSYHDPEFQREALEARTPNWPGWIRNIKMGVPRRLYWILTFLCALALPLLNAAIQVGGGN
jgi:hypothetical protein